MSLLQEFTCIFCKDVFDNKEDLQTHFRKHGDPKFDQNSRNKNRFHNESQTSEDKSNEEIKMIGCDVCTEVFPTISKAITHKHKVHPDHDAKYFCPWCGKLFTLKHLFDRHMETSHDSPGIKLNKSLFCDCCNVEFYLASAMLYHNKVFHRQDTEFPAIGQSKKQKLYQQELVPIYYCSFCGEEYNNKVNLHKHIGDDHLDENQTPDEVLRCPLCEAIFYHLDAYELHLTFHSSDDIYSETNEMNSNKITDFSLDNIPPITERVENCEPQEDIESTISAMGIESFLQLAMDEPNNDNTSDLPEKVKTKKHKKHKKSKKPAITLDEFLNMNKDVFGEGLDFQGIEEVPTQVVAKQLKVKQKPQTKIGRKLMSSNELDKLRKQGIIVKVKSDKPSNMQGIKIGTKIPMGNPVKVKNANLLNKVKTTTQTKPNVLMTSNDVLSKLINQSNNQIKIVKKSIQETTNTDNLNEDPVTTASKMLKTSLDKGSVSSEKKEIECVVEQRVKDVSETESENNADEKLKQTPHKEVISSINASVNTNTKNAEDMIIKPVSSNESNDENLSLVNESNGVEKDNDNNILMNKCTINTSDHKSSEISGGININKSLSNSLNTLRNISQQLTVKPICQSVNDRNTKKQTNPAEVCEEDNDDEHEKIDENNLKNVSSIIETNVNETAKSLNTLKFLSSHITIKPINQINDATSLSVDNELNSQKELKLKSDDEEEKNCQPGIIKMSQLESSKIKSSLLQKDPSSKSFDVLKSLSKHITIKSTKHSTNEESNDNNTDDDENDHNSGNDTDHEDELDSENVVSNKCRNTEKIQADENIQLKATNILIKTGSEITTQPSTQSLKVSIPPNNKDVKNKQGSSNLLKNLKNITAKPLPIVKNHNQYQSATSVANVTKKNVIQKCVQKEEINEKEEIFNIDDSDSDEAYNKQVYNSDKNVEYKHATVKQMDAFKNISKHVTVKSIIQHSNEKPHRNNTNVSDQCDDDTDAAIKHNVQKSTMQNMIIQRTLKNLGKNITVRSQNSSPNPSIKSQEFESQDCNYNNQMDDADSDSDSYSGKVKITEITEDIDDDVALKQVNKIHNKGVVIKSPNESISENDFDEELDEDLSDFENEIKANTLVKPNQPLNSHKLQNSIQSFKNISKDITIKSLNDTKTGENEPKLKPENQNNSITSNELAIRPYNKQIKTTCQNENKGSSFSSNKCSSKVTNQSIINQKVSTSANQVNSVNKEVVVKTFQTKTVIQEITTTVTKTIKTVNQITNQEIRNTNSTQVIRSQKNIQGTSSSNQQGRIQGIMVRNPSPRPKVKNATTPVRPIVGTTIRPSNQLVPVRPGLNLIRGANPRMPAVKKTMPSTSNQQTTVIGQPLKMSPNVFKTSMKRPASVETTGPFSCFKKPKESLIPVSDVPGFSGDQDGESTLNFASASHMTKSNFTSTTKTMKGNSVVTSSQMKSEVNSSSQQQLSRLSNVSGLKIMKTSQNKQASQFEERSEISASKRTTLDAIEKLQKQGLLVKKPRVDTNDCEHSDTDDDNET